MILKFGINQGKKMFKLGISPEKDWAIVTVLEIIIHICANIKLWIHIG